VLKQLNLSRCCSGCGLGPKEPCIWPAITGGPVIMPFVVCTRGGSRNHLVGGGLPPLQKGDFKYCSNLLLLLLLLYIITLHCCTARIWPIATDGVCQSVCL